MRKLFSKEGSAWRAYELNVNTEHQLLVRRGRALSVPEKFVVAQAQPGVFTVNEQGSGQAFVLHARDQTLADMNNPATGGEELTVLCTGLGEVSAAVEPGGPTPDPAPMVVAPVQVFIAGRQAGVKSAELTPGVVGRYRVRFILPLDVIPGNEVPLTIVVAGRSSAIARPPTFAVKP